MKKLIDILLCPFKRFQDYRKFKKRMKDLRKRDPFIYK